MPRICWQTIFICGNHRGNGKPLKQLELLSHQADIRRVTGASSVNFDPYAINRTLSETFPKAPLKAVEACRHSRPANVLPVGTGRHAGIQCARVAALNCTA
jgi:hypothetical protein